MSTKPITITATVAAWIPSWTKPHELLAHIEAGKITRAINHLQFYGDPSQETFGDYTRVGEADIAVRLLPKDEQVRLAVKALQDELDKARAAWLEKQRQIMEQISSLQALEYVES